MEIAILIFVIINTASNLALVLSFIRRKNHIPKQLEKQKREQQELLKKWLVARGDENDKL